MLKRLIPVAALVPVLALGACLVDESESTDPAPHPDAGFKAEYVPLGQILPFPNDLIISQTDGTVNLTVQDPTDFGNPLVAINQLDGFSPIASAYLSTTDTIEGDSLQPWTPTDPGNVALVDITDPQAPTPLTHGQDYEVVVSGIQEDAEQRLFFNMLEPVGEKRQLLAIVTNGIESTVGDPLAADYQFGLIKETLGADLSGDCATIADEFANRADGQNMVAICQAVAQQLGAAGALGYSPANVSAAWTFSTQSITDSLDAVAGTVEDRTAVIQQARNPENGDPITTQTLLGQASPGFGNVWVGYIELPYYLDSSEPRSGFWQAQGGMPITRYTPVPEATETVEVPLFVTVPNDTARNAQGCEDSVPQDGHPVVMFQHGIRGNRTQAAAIADAFACRGFAVVAIDHPLHGVVPADQNPLIDMDRERHFFLDVDGDGTVDDSGEHYINLTSLLTSRDNLRQSVADLLNLSATVSGTIVTADAQGNPTGTLNINGANKHFVGHSLGGIAGASFVGFDDSVVSATLGMPGGNFTDLLRDSDSFGPQINAGLQQINPGLVPGTRLYNDFFRQAQTVIDAGDPANYGEETGDSNILMFQVSGDSVVPNSATAYLADAHDIEATETGGVDPTGNSALVRYTEGGHGSLLDPSASPEVTAAMRCQMVTYAESGGTAIDLTGAISGNPDCDATGRVE